MNALSPPKLPLLALRVTLVVICIFHLTIGLGVNLSEAFVGKAAELYGASPDQWSDQFLYILRPLGIFMCGLGVFAAAAALRPLENRLTIYVFAAIFAIRGAQRILFNEEIATLYGIAESRNFNNMLFFFFSAGLLVVLDLWVARGSRGPAMAAAGQTA